MDTTIERTLGEAVLSSSSHAGLRSDMTLQQLIMPLVIQGSITGQDGFLTSVDTVSLSHHTCMSLTQQPHCHFATIVDS